MKHRAFTLIEMVVVIVITCILAAILYPVLAPRPPHGAYRSACMSNLKQLGLGVMQYVQDYDETYPPTQNAMGGWSEIVQPYVKSTQILQCRSDKSGDAPKTTDYFYNARLAGVKQKQLNFSSMTILMGDGAGDSAPSYALSQLPDAWRKDQSSPAWRHLDGANYSFADGHVKWFKPEKLTLDKPSKNNPTFLVK